ncbi:MAG: RNA polymerase sigma factor SigZ [Chloroflexota bacterium]
MYMSSIAHAAVAPAEEIDDEIVRLISRHERALFNFLLLQVGNVDVAQDCLQDVFLRAYENLHKGKPVNAAWLYKVARHRAIDGFRKNRWTLSADEALNRAASSSRTEHDVAVRLVLESMPRHDREVLYLFEVAGFRTEEIGCMLGIRGSAVRQRLYRARERFRTMYRSEM